MASFVINAGVRDQFHQLPQKKVTPKKKEQQQANVQFHKVKTFTPQIVAVDFGASMATALCTSLIVAPIDKTIMEKTLGIRPTISGGLQDAFSTLFRTPWKFFFSTDAVNNYSSVYRLVVLQYSMTYFAGNVVQSYCESKNKSYGLEKFSAGSIANVLLTLYKDNSLLQMLSPNEQGKAPRPVPNVSRLLFVIRDCMTVFASFWVAPLVAESFKKAMPKLTDRQASDCADFVVPASLQFIATPLHLYGIALKENPDKTPREIVRLLRSSYLPAVAARTVRIIPPFGFGMMIMKRLRSKGGERVEGPN